MDFHPPGKSRKEKVFGSTMVLLVTALMIVSTLAVAASGQQSDHSYLSVSSGAVSVKGNGVLDHRQLLNATQNNTLGTPSSVSTSGSPRQLWLGSVNGSYLQPIYIPVYSSDLGSFSNLTQTFSYDPNILTFNGVLGDVASENVTFSYSVLVSGIVMIFGNGIFGANYPQTVLYYLAFKSTVNKNVETSVLLDNSSLGNTVNSAISESGVTLSRGWTNLGPQNFSSYDPYPGYSNQNTPVYLSGGAPSIGYSPYNLSVLYVASGRGGPWGANLYQADSVSGFGGIFKSTDSGKSWYSVDNGLNSTIVTSIAVDPQDPNVVVITTGGIASIVGGGIYKTVNGGESWQETYPLGGNFLTFYNGALYAASYHTVLISSDFGSTWKIVHSFADIVTTMALSENGNTVFVGLYQPTYVSILKSNDGGTTFTDVFREYGQYSVSQIQVDPTNSSRMMSLIYQGYTFPPNLFNSTDGGNSWSAINDSKVGITYNVYYGSGFQNGVVVDVPQAFSYDPLNGSIIYVVGPSGAFKSTDGGSHYTWVTMLGAGSPNDVQGAGGDERMVNIDPLNDSIIYIGSDQGLSVSKNGGISWELLNNRSSTMVYTVAASGSYIFTTVQDWAPEFSSNYGKSWFSAPGSEEGWASVDPYNSSRVIIAGYDYVSSDGGKSFTKVAPDSTFGYSGNTSKNVIAIAYSSNGTVFAVGENGIMRSVDGGYVWNMINGSPGKMSVLTIDPVNQKVLYSSGESSNFSAPGLYKSVNGGETWHRINDTFFNSLAVDPSNDSIVAGVIYRDDTYGQLVISLDGGMTFKNLNFNSTDMFVASPQVFFYQQNGTTFLIYTTDQGIYTSTNIGATWINMTYNVPSRIISNVFVSNNGSAYLSTYGTGIWYDPTLFDINQSLEEPILTGYLPEHESIKINGNNFTTSGYFSYDLNGGNNSIFLSSLSKSVYLTGEPGKIYYENFSSLSSIATIDETGLPQGALFNLSINGHSLQVENGDQIHTGILKYNFSVMNFVSDYVIYSPTPQNGVINGVSLFNIISITFSGTVASSFRNTTSEFKKGPFWTTSVSYENGYVIYAGGGNIALLNISSNITSTYRFPSSKGDANAVAGYGSGFLIGGSSSPKRPGIYYFSLKTRSFDNYTLKLPASWSGNFSAITSLFVINSTTFAFMGSSNNSVFFGLLDGEKFTNLVQYLPSTFNPTGLVRYSGAYVASIRGIVISSGKDIGIFYPDNKSFFDISSYMPTDFFVGIPANAYSPSTQFVASNKSSVMITGFTGLGPMEVIYTPGRGASDISKDFPASEYIETVSWTGTNYVLSGYSVLNSTPPIFIYYPQNKVLSAIGTSHYGNLSLVDSVIMVGNSVYFTAFNSQPILDSVNVRDFSYYGLINLTPTGTLRLDLNVPSVIEINSQIFYGENQTLFDFSGSYTINISSPGFLNYDSIINILPFETIYLNLTMITEPCAITFEESGLSSGTYWYVTLDATTRSSASRNITFLEPDGTYSFNVGSILGYTNSPSSSSVTVDGSNLTENIKFTLTSDNGYFVGSITPSDVTIAIFVNGSWQPFKETNGSFNISLVPGTYRVSISSPGHMTYTFNLTVYPSRVTYTTITTLPSESTFSLLEIEVTAVLILVIAALTTTIILRRRR